MKTTDPYLESMRYIENAKESLKLAGRDGKFYLDEKYIKTGCGTAYSGMLKALNFLFDFRKVPKQRGRKSIEYYRTVLGRIDKKLLNHLNNAYEVLHLSGYYDGINSVKIIADGFDHALAIISALKPYSKNGRA